MDETTLAMIAMGIGVATTVALLVLLVLGLRSLSGIRDALRRPISPNRDDRDDRDE